MPRNATDNSIELPQLVVFADDWGRHPSSCQHLVRQLLERWSVTWVNTIGTRSPGLNLQTLRRGWEKLRQWNSRQPSAPASELVGPRILSPRMWPRFTTQPERNLNRRILAHFLQKNVAGLENAVMLTTLPIVADLVGELAVRKWLYYCVDDFSTWPGLDARPLRRMEDLLAARVDQVVAAGDNLAAPLRDRARRMTVLTHGVDLEFWQPAKSQAGLPDDLTKLEPPYVLFWGLIDRRLDMEILHHLGSRLDRGTIVLVGPEQDPDPRLDQVPHLVRVGARPMLELPALAEAAHALIMPYADLPVTRAMQPLKLKEYLATGKPVISTPLPAVSAWRDCLDSAGGPEGFGDAVERRLQAGISPDQRAARRRLSGESWVAKSLELEALLLENVPSGEHEFQDSSTVGSER